MAGLLRAASGARHLILSDGVGPLKATTVTAGAALVGLVKSRAVTETPRDRTVVVGGQRFHYTEWGSPSAPPVVLLHGVTSHARSWDDVAGALMRTHRVLAVDQRGHGDSDPAPDGDYTTAAMAADLDAFLRELAVSRPSIVGLSMGGRVAIAYAGGERRRVSRLVVVDIGPEIDQPGRARVGALLAQAPERFESIDEAFAFARAGNPRYVESLLRERIALGVRPLPGGGWTWKYDRVIRDSVRNGRWHDPIDLWPCWRAIDCPTLVVRGTESDILSTDMAKQMIEALPQARLVEVSGAGHTVPGDQPEAFTALVATFLAP
jgi:esterase